MLKIAKSVILIKTAILVFFIKSVHYLQPSMKSIYLYSIGDFFGICREAHAEPPNARQNLFYLHFEVKLSIFGKMAKRP